MKLKLAIGTFLCALSLQIPLDVPTDMYVRFKMRQIQSDLAEGRLPITGFMEKLNMGSVAFAEGKGDPSCEKQEGVRIKCAAAWADYAHGALKFFNGTLCRFNNETAAEVENVLCHFRKSMGVKVDLASLPMSAEKTFAGMTVKVEIVAPSEAWAVSAGYQAKGTVTVNSDTYMVLYWGGKEEKSKGFMIEGFKENGLGGRRAGYLTWDLTNTEAQAVKMYHANFPSGSYLSSASKQSDSYRGDAAIYGSVNFNKTTSAVSTQVVMIEEQRSGGTAGQFGCFRMYSSGIKNAQITVAKTQNSLNGSGHLATSTSKILDDMDGVTLTDSTTTANFTGTQLNSQGALESALGLSSGAQAFTISCGDLNDAGGSAGAKIFSSSRSQKVNFDASVSDIFP